MIQWYGRRVRDENIQRHVIDVTLFCEIEIGSINNNTRLLACGLN